MSEVFRFIVVAPAYSKSKSKLEKVGVTAYRKGALSGFSMLQRQFFAAQDFLKMRQEAENFVNGQNFISDYSQLSRVLNLYSDYFETTEQPVSFKDFNAFYKENFNETSKYVQNEHSGEREKVADSLLALSILGIAEDKGHIDYKGLIKTMQLLEELVNTPDPFNDYRLNKLLTAPVVLPANILGVRPVESGNPLSKLNSFASKITSKRLSPSAKKTSKDVTNPNTDPCNCTESCDDECIEQRQDCAPLIPYISDLMVVREELKCYEEGDLSYIENMLQGEKRQRNHRFLTRTETYNETEMTTVKSEERDHQVSERFELQNESNKVINKDTSMDAGVTVNAEYGKSISLSSSFNYSTSSSSSSTTRAAKAYAKNVVDRAVSKIQETVRELSSRKQIIETEEINNHEFDNTKGTDHIAGLYYHVNKVMKLKLLNYGKRLTFSFILHEPAKPYKDLIQRQENVSLNENESNLPDAPQPPAALPEYADIDETNYSNYIKDWQLTDVDHPPVQTVKLTTGINWIEEEPEKFSMPHSNLSSEGIQITPGYIAKTVYVSGGIVWAHFRKDEWGDPHPRQLFLGVGKAAIKLWNQTQDTEDADLISTSAGMNDETAGKLPVTVTAYGARSYGLKIEVECARTPELLEAWKLEFYGKLTAVYNSRYADFEKKKAEWDALKQQNEIRKNTSKPIVARNPFFNREAERFELKKQIIAIISCQYFDDFNAMKYKVQPCGYPQLNTLEAQEQGRMIEFFEKAFEWNLMTYIFYPYFWGRKCSWVENVQRESGDPLFDKFLSAGAARAEITVRPEWESKLMWFLATGEIPDEHDTPPIPGDIPHLSVAQEILAQQGIYYTDRAGHLEVTNGKSEVIYYGEDIFDDDVNREIFIGCAAYMITKIVAQDDADCGGSANKWVLTLNRPYEGGSRTCVKFQVGAKQIGCWETRVPTNLIYLRNRRDCLPCYPLEKCTKSNAPIQGTSEIQL